MLEPNNRIVIVDNEPDELFQLGKVFIENGLPCRTFEYDQFYNSPLNNVRVAFFDIKLNPAGTEKEEQIFSTLADAIKLYIDKNNPPFALIFWTDNSKLISKFTRFVKERYEDVPSPFIIDCIDKVEINNSPALLSKKLNEILSKPAIKMLFDFEARAYRAASQTINRFFKVIPHNDEWGKDTAFSSNFELVFSKVASHSLGFAHAKENPDRAVYEALLPILNHDFIINHTNNTWKSQLVSLKNATRENELKYPETFESSVLNSIFHIDEVMNVAKDYRGVVISLDSIKDSFKRHFNITFTDWFNRFLPGVKKAIRNNCKIIAVEISASCDFSQKKPRTNKYLLGIIMDVSGYEQLDKERIPQNLFILDGNYLIKNESKNICLNLNYVFDSKPTSKMLGEVLFTFKKQIVDIIGNRYANHVSRIGITSF